MLVYLALVALALFVLVALVRLRASGDDRGAGEGPDWGDGGGNLPTSPRGPIDPDDSAAWWPEFERQFAEWVERTQRAEAGVGTRSAG
jgi:hypothetical protein